MIYSVFLRGINTGGLKLKNEEFAHILYEVGCENIKTIQAAGTAVFTFSGKEITMLQKAMEDNLSEFMGKEISSILRSQEEINKILKTVEPIKSEEDYHDYIILTDTSNLFQEVIHAHESIPYSEGERLLDGEGYLLWSIKKGDTLNDFGSKILGSSKFKKKLTSRNVNTIQKAAAAMKEIQKKLI